MMTAPALLVVAIVRDLALGSVLAAQLACRGANVLTATGYTAIARRRLREPAILIVDEEAMEGAKGDWIAELWRERRWSRVIVLTIDAPLPASDRDWLVFADRASSARTLAHLIELPDDVTEPEPQAA